MCRLEHFSNCYPLFLRVLLLIRNQNSLLTGHHGHVYFFSFALEQLFSEVDRRKGCVCNDLLCLATLSLFSDL